MLLEICFNIVKSIIIEDLVLTVDYIILLWHIIGEIKKVSMWLKKKNIDKKYQKIID